MHSETPQRAVREKILRVMEAAIRAVDPAAAVHAHVSLAGNSLKIGGRAYALDEVGRIIVVGGGKAGAPMAAALYEILEERIDTGFVNVKRGHTAAAGGWQVRFGHGGEPLASPQRARAGPITIAEASHPVPDEAGMAGAEAIHKLVQDLSPHDLVIVLISGGGSALLPLPVSPITLADYQALTNTLLRSGATITEINTLRKHCSRLQGGQLARLAAPASVATLILSDVVGTPLDAIASGPTVPDRTSFTDAQAVLERYGIEAEIPATIRLHLATGADGRIPETPKPGDPLFAQVNNVVIGDNASAGRAAVVQARHEGWQSQLLTTFVQGEAREVGRAVVGLAQGIAWGQSDILPPVCLVMGGETTVTLRGQGMGGRNQELALAAAIALDEGGLPAGVEAAIVSLATDGSDGPTDASGGIATGETLARGRTLNLDAHAALAANDSYHYLSTLGDLIVTGPTNTNVNDLILVFVY